MMHMRKRAYAVESLRDIQACGDRVMAVRTVNQNRCLCRCHDDVFMMLIADDAMFVDAI